MANTVHGYMSQSDKGELVIGGGADGFNNYTQRGAFQHIEETVRCPVSRPSRIISAPEDVAPVGRHRGHDRRPLPHHLQNPGGGRLHQLRLGHRRVQGDSGLGLGDGWVGRQGGDDIADPFSLDRFTEGRMIDESVAAAVAH